jgi:non-heme chloroperoxidase
LRRDRPIGAANWPLRSITVNGTELHYIEAGAGDPVVFVHGTLGDYRSWLPQLGPFSERFRVLSYSRRYHYRNAWADDGLDYSASLHVDDLAAFIDSLAVAPAHVVSASYGSYVALVHALKYPNHVRSLVVGEPPMLDWLAEMNGGRPLAQEFLEKTLLPAYEALREGRTVEGIRWFIDGVHGVAGAFDRFTPAVRQMLLDNGPEIQAESRSNRLFPAFGCADAARIGCPVLLLSGALSPALFHLITDELERCLPHAERVTIPAVSHAMNAARPRTYNEVVLRFLSNRDI